MATTQTLTVTIPIDGAITPEVVEEIAQTFAFLADDIRFYGHINSIDGNVRDESGATVGTITLSDAS